MSEDLQNILKQELNLLNDSSNTLEYSYKACNRIGIKEKYTEEELESYEALCSRFARLTDIMIQKILKSIELVDLETPGTIRDRINSSYKKGIITNADKLIEVRVLRNEIAHEYLPEAFKDIFEKVIEHCSFIFENVLSINNYCKTKYNF